MGVHPHAPMKGVLTVAVSLVFVSVFPRGVRPDQADRGGASLRAPRGRLQSVDPTKLNNALAPRAAGRAEASLRALLLVPVASDEDWTRKMLRALYALCASGGVSVRLAFASARRYFRGI